MKPGNIVNIPAGVKHWRGPGSRFRNPAAEVPGEGTRNEWLEPVDNVAYNQTDR